MSDLEILTVDNPTQLAILRSKAKKVQRVTPKMAALAERMLETMRQDYITTARAKGLRESTVVNKYGVRVAINPLISVLALEIPKMISESALVGIVMSAP